MTRIVAAVALLSSFSLLGACSSASDEPQSDSASRSTSEPLTTVPVGANKVYGIDVSHFQGAVNWSSEKGKGRVFAVASVGDGLYQDPMFATNWAGMKAAGLIRGAYQYFEPGDDPIAQANILIAKVGMLGDGDLPATVDVEVTGGQSKATIAARLGQWLARVEAGTGKKPMIYTGPYFWEANVGSSAFLNNPLWVADYGPPAPLVPSPWKSFKLWQYSDSGGTLDLDLFDGTLAELQAFAGSGSGSTAPHGTLESADCTGIKGWAQDGTAATAAGVHLSFGAAEGKPGAVVLPIVAGDPRGDLCKSLGSCNHGFDVPVPFSLRDGAAHDVYAAAVGSAAGASVELAQAPKSFTCAAPELPLAPPAGVRRAVTGPTVLTAWKLSTFTDVAHYGEAQVEAFPSGDAFPATPDLIVGDNGAPEVWLVDGGKKRHVVNPASMAAWRFGTPVKTPAATIAAMPQGPDWRPSPFLVQGTAPTLYVLDLAPSTPPGAATNDPHAGTSPSAPAPGDGNTAPPSDDAGSSSGCQVTSGAPSRSGLGGLAALCLACAAMVRRRRRNA